MEYSAYLKYLRHCKRLIIKKGSPLYMLVHSTHRCTACCKHCFVKDERRNMPKSEELTLHEYEKITRGMDDLMWVNMTGGEPFIRDDIPEIMYQFYKNNKVRIFKIDSNGSQTNKIMDSTGSILKLCKNAQVVINLSIDGIGKDHDNIRNSKGLFKKVIETYWGLKDIQESNNNLGVSAEVTVSSYNEDKLGEIFGYYVNTLGLKNLNHVWIRGSPRDPAAKNVDISKYKEFSRLVDEFMYQGKGFKNFAYSTIINAKNIVARDMIERIIKTNSYQIPCYAGILNATLYSNGDLVFCEMTEELMGNLKEVDYDFKRIWFSKKADKMREKVRQNKCFCTHECYLNTAIIFNPLLLPRLMGESVNIVASSLARGLKNVLL